MKIPYHSVQYGVHPEPTNRFIAHEVCSSSLHSDSSFYWILYLLPNHTFKILRFKKRREGAAIISIDRDYTDLRTAAVILVGFSESNPSVEYIVKQRFKRIRESFSEEFEPVCYVNKITEI